MALEHRELLFETLILGDHARVAAIDSATGIEVTVAGPANAARHDLERLARRKLERALIDAGVIVGGDGDGDGETAPIRPPGARGKLV
jgi:hypothetical protein